MDVESRVLIEWFLRAVDIEPFSGAARGIRDGCWPRRGGLMKQDAKLIDAVDVLLSEWAQIRRLSDAEKQPEQADKKRT